MIVMKKWKNQKKKKIKIEKDVIIKHEPTDTDYYILPTLDNTTTDNITMKKSGEGSKKIKKGKKIPSKKLIN